MPDVVSRWLQYMSTFDVHVEFRAGRLHGNADGMSRPPIEGCGERACICSAACRSITALAPQDGEPDMETHPDIETVTTTLIAVLTRGGTQTQEEETCESEVVAAPLSPQIPCGQPTQLVTDIPTESDEDVPGTAESVLSVLRSDDEEDLTASDRLTADWRGRNYVDEDDDLPSSASSDELFSDEVDRFQVVDTDSSGEESESLIRERPAVDGKADLEAEAVREKATRLATELKELARELVFGEDNRAQADEGSQLTLSDVEVPAERSGENRPGPRRGNRHRFRGRSGRHRKGCRRYNNGSFIRIGNR